MTNQYNPLGSFDWEQEQTPEQQFRQYAMLQFTPGEARRALYSQHRPLLQRYLLRTPLESGAGGFGAPGGGFRQYAQTLGAQGAGPTPLSLAELRARAREAADIGQLTGQQFAESDPSLAGQFYRSQYGTGRDAMPNQLALAQTLALARPDTQAGGYGGMYGGVLGRAITGALEEMYENYVAQTPTGNFLDWYLQRTAPGSV